MENRLIKDLMKAMGESGIEELDLKKGDVELKLRRPSSHSIPPLAATAPFPKESQEQMFASMFPRPLPIPIQMDSSKEHKKEESIQENIAVKSPMVGTFYSSAAPGDPPFIQEGDSVDENTLVCIVEAMKVMNEVKAGVKGVIKKVLVEDGATVEFGSELFYIHE